jgi:hypothetical protein
MMTNGRVRISGSYGVGEVSRDAGCTSGETCRVRNRRPGDVMDIHYHTQLTDQECTEIDEWSGTHRTDGIASISVHDRLVSVQGHQDHISAALGTAARQGDLIGELNLALANLRSVWPIPPQPTGEK